MVKINNIETNKENVITDTREITWIIKEFPETEKDKVLEKCYQK